MYLIDTNVWMHRLLEHTHADEVNHFLSNILSDEIRLTDFALFSLGITINNLKKPDLWIQFLKETVIESDLQIISLTFQDLMTIPKVISKFNFDFDDAYQYVAAEKYDLTIVSFDHDFDKTERGRKTPAEVLKEIK